MENLANVSEAHPGKEDDTERLCLAVSKGFAAARARRNALVVIDDERSVPQINGHEISKIKWPVEMQMCPREIGVLKLSEVCRATQDVIDMTAGPAALVSHARRGVWVVERNLTHSISAE